MSLSKQKGSVLLSAVIFMAILTIICVSFSQLTIQEKRAAIRSHYNFCLLNAAEAGLEEAIWAINNEKWTDWSAIRSGKDQYRQPQVVPVGDGTRATVQTLVRDQGTSPVIYSTASVTLPNGEVVSKQLRVAYSTADSAGGGMVSKGLIDLGGQPTFDSYDSRKGPPHPTLNRGDKITVATVSGGSEMLKLSGQVDIYGYAGTAGAKPYVSGPDNKIHGSDTPSGTNIDSSRVFNDFTYEFPPVEEPDWSGAASKLPSASGGVITLGDPGGAVKKYKVDKLDLSDTNVKVVGPVQLHLQDGMSVSGKAFVEVDFSGQLEIYTPKDVTISGQAIVNKTSQPKNFKVLGTVKKANDQTFSLSGQGLMEAVFYFPNGKANISGQGDLAGSIVANELTMSGQMAVHYDEIIRRRKRWRSGNIELARAFRIQAPDRPDALRQGNGIRR